MLGILKYLLLGAIFCLLQSLVQGVVFRNLYGWFVVPTFRVEPISYMAATGIGLMISYLTYQIRSGQMEEDHRSAFEAASETFLLHLFYSAIFLAIGWVIKDAM